VGAGRASRRPSAPTTAPEEHLRDTLVAGVGLCDVDAVRVLCTEGPARLRELIALGAPSTATRRGSCR
jgi:aspartate oxidase